MVQSLGLIPNLKKSEMKPAQQFTFIGMEFLTQHNSVRVPLDCTESLLNQTISNSDSSFSSNFPFFLGETQCCSTLSSSRQISFMPTSDVSVDSLETSYTSFGSSNFDHKYDPISIGGWIPMALFREHTSILQIPMHSFLLRPVIMDGVLILNRWDYPFMVAGQDQV